MSPSRPSRITLVAAGLLALLFGLLAFRAERGDRRLASSGPPARVAPPGTGAPPVKPEPKRVARAAPRLLPAAGEAAAEAGAVVLQKRAVCRGEDNLARVSLAGLWADDPHRRVYLVGHDAVGLELPFRFSRTPDKMPAVVVEGSGGRARVLPLPEVKVKDCEAPYQVNVTRRLLSPTADRYEFTTDVLTGPGRGERKFVPARWHWDFGDGSSQMTEYAKVTHDFGSRPQAAQYSSFLVRVELAGTDGARQVGYTTVELVNWRFAAN